MSFETVIIIPSRIGSTRLPNKPLSQIGHLSLIEHVIVSLQNTFKDNIYIATDSEKIAKIINNHDVKVIMTDPECKTGSDRVYEALRKIPNNAQIKYVINIQGDMPFVNPKIVEQIVQRLKQNDCDIVTSIVKVDKDIASSESNVKVVFDNNWNALYFSRSMIPHGAEEFYYHVGIYGFHASSLEQFIKLKQSKYETCEKLEQLRAIENGMKIGVCLTNEIPISVDTPEDLEKAICYYKTSIK
ncbi:3-deoxy-manno-octulosonate cytidylyltransferase [Acinetobacter sp.]|uniref:3-deoxy-manno-octulosonate cytidylyltransferase n=1 Tax=Acinetobacter sp. TaxID=472 RepID=UPI0025C57E64|nr:3-deoxy-manno-octulosonate cytidylyltransferase [Acinetobacter sp.]